MEASPTTSVSSDVQRIADLAQAAAHHAAELLRAEFALAKDEFRNDLQLAKKRALGLALGALLLQAGITLLALGFVLLLGATATAAFATGSVLAALALISALFGEPFTVTHLQTLKNAFFAARGASLGQSNEQH
jgi:hypothetical protein